MVAKLLLFTLLVWECLANPLDKQVKKTLPYRLDSDITVNTYDIKLKIPDNFHIENTFDGEVTINFIVGAAVLNEIKINCDQTICTSINAINIDITVDAGTTIEKAKDTNFDKDAEILTIGLNNPLAVGQEVTLTINPYKGKIYTEDLHGIYLSTYDEKEGETVEKRYTVATQFEPTYARRAFPCFDEPKYKSKFTLTLEYPGGYKAVSNSKPENEPEPGARLTTKFKETQKMPTYLVAFAVHKMGVTNVVEGKMDIYYPYKFKGTELFAKTISKDILGALNEYTGINWDNTDTGVEKMDQIVIPEFAAGAMENWGLVTYKDIALLYDENNSGSYNMERVISIIAHEFAHMWFGNLVTLEKWDYTWLNEGFATFFEHYIPDQLTASKLINEDFERMKQLPLVEQQLVFLADADPNSKALNHPVSTQSEISNKFDDISYNKGGSILHMMYNFIGPNAFQEKIKAYLNAQKGQNAIPDDFLDAFDSINIGGPTATPVKTIMDEWLNKPGFPVVTATLEAGGIKLNQAVFTYSKQTEPEGSEEGKKTQGKNGNTKTDEETIWKIPISYKIIKEETESEEKKTWLTAATTNMDLTSALGENEAIILNIDETGYYRVNYDETLWDRIKKVLDADPSKISDLNRAQIVDDVLNLARADKIKYDFAFNQIEFLKNEVNYYPWYSAFQGFSFLLKHLTDTSREAMKSYLIEYSEKLYQEVNNAVPNNHIQRLRKSMVWKWACEFQNPSCVQKATELFEKIDQTPIPTDLRPAVYCSAIRKGAEAEWTKLYEKLTDVLLHPTEKETVITALGCSQDPARLNSYLQNSLEGTIIKSQDAYKVFEAVLIGNPQNVDIALDFFIQNFKLISEKYGSLKSVTKIINNLADRITTEEQKNKFSAFVKDTATDLGEAQVAADAALLTIQANLDWYDANNVEIMNFLNSYTTTSSTSSTTTSSSTESTTTVSTTTLGAAQATVSIILLTALLIFGKLF